MLFKKAGSWIRLLSMPPGTSWKSEAMDLHAMQLDFGGLLNGETSHDVDSADFEFWVAEVR